MWNIVKVILHNINSIYINHSALGADSSKIFPLSRATYTFVVRKNSLRVLQMIYICMAFWSSGNNLFISIDGLQPLITSSICTVWKWGWSESHVLAASSLIMRLKIVLWLRTPLKNSSTGYSYLLSHKIPNPKS